MKKKLALLLYLGLFCTVMPMMQQEAYESAIEEEGEVSAREQEQEQAAEYKERAQKRQEGFKPQQESKPLLSGIMVYPRRSPVTKEEDEESDWYGGGGEKVEIISSNCQGLVILLDDSEKWPRSGAITFTALAALYNHVPFLASASVMKNIFDLKQVSSQEYESGARKFLTTGDSSGFQQSDYSNILLRNTLVRRAFDPVEWEIRQIGESLLLFLPKSLVQKAGHGNPTSDDKVLTERELNLGLKIDHQKRLDGKQLQAFLDAYKVPQHVHYFMRALWNSLGATSEIFVTNAEYKRHKAEHQQTEWSLYLSGHGEVGVRRFAGSDSAGIDPTIASLTLYEFQALLSFLNGKEEESSNKILTKILICQSCYAMGTNMQKAFEELKKPGQGHSYSFPIVISSTYDTVTSVGSPPYRLHGDELWPEFPMDFSKFFQIIWSKTYKSEPYDSAQIVFPLNTIFLQQLNMYPHIRPAGRNYFISLFPGVEIGTVMTKSRTQPLDVVAASQQRGVKFDKTYVLLHADPPKNEQAIRFPLIVRKYKEQQGPPFFISATTGTARHYIEKIVSDYPLFDIIKNMVPIAMGIFVYYLYGAEKIFFIHEFIENKDDQQTVYRDVVIDFGPAWKSNAIKVYYTLSDGMLKQASYITLYTHLAQLAQDKSVMDKYYKMFKFARE